MTLTQCPKCGTALADGATSCSACGWMATDPAGGTIVTTERQKRDLSLRSSGETLMIEQRDALFDQLKEELAGDYALEKELGRGGMAVVYKAIENDLHRVVALKVLPPSMGHGTMAERFKREARMAAALDHPHIIPVYRVGQAAGTYFFAMKFVEGRAVDAIIESQGALPVPVVLQILRASASALAFAHQRGIVHRDIKGANILVDRDGRVMVSDFGIARAAEEKTLTASGSVIGTPHFMSPEQCSGAKVGPQSDQYSLGVLAFQMLTGSVPFDAESLMGILQHHFFTSVPDIAGVRQGVPPLLITIVHRVLAKDPAQRYQTTKEMLQAIEQIPFGDAERREAEGLLQQLAIGSPVPRVRTGSLPPLADARLSGSSTSAPTVAAPAPGRRTAPAARPAPKRSRVPLVVGAVAALAGAGIGGKVIMDRRAATAQAAADATARAESIHRADSIRQATDSLAALRTTADSVVRADSAKVPPVAVRTPASQRRAPQPAQRPPVVTPPAAAAGAAFLSIRTQPTNAEVSLDGRPLTPGGGIDMPIPAGRHTVRVRASGFVERSFTITPADGEHLNLHTVQLVESQP